MQKKTCFVISPIGEEGSDVRRHADDFLELLVEPALAKFGFTVIRADKIARASMITNDIVELVQRSDLCLVDLTFHNPNVFYECGRRHETGRPTIQLIKKGEDLPFDVAGIRTLEYNLENPRTTLESVKKIAEFVGAIDLTNSYGPESSGASLATIAATLARIEKKIEGSDLGRGLSSAEALNRRQLISMHPAEAFYKAMEQGDVASARFVLPRIKQFLGTSEWIQALSTLCETGDEQSKNELLQLLPSLVEDKAYSDMRMALAGFTDYCHTTASFAQGITVIQPIIDSIANNTEHPEKERAFALNRIQMLRYQDGQYTEALIDGLRTVELVPDDNSYWYNLSLIYKRLKRFKDASDSALKFVEYCKDPKPHHLEHVREVFNLAGRDREFEQVLAKFR